MAERSSTERSLTGRSWKVAILEPDPQVGANLAAQVQASLPGALVRHSDAVSRAFLRDAALVIAGPGSTPEALTARTLPAAPNADGAIVKVFAPEPPADVVAWVEAGANGFVESRGREAEFRLALETVLAGGGYISRSLLADCFDTLRARRRERARMSMTPREQEVLAYIALNLSNKDIARRLGLSVRTVETHRLHIRKKTGAGNRRDLLALAADFGLSTRYPLPAEPSAQPRHLHENEDPSGF